MKTTMMLVLGVLAFGTATEARAQYNFVCGPECTTVVGTLGVVDASMGFAGAVFATGTTVTVAQGRMSKWWFSGSYAFGTINLLLSVFWGAAAVSAKTDAGLWAVFAAHATVAVWGITIPTIGLIRGERPQSTNALTLAPVIVQGRDAGGNRWAGVGVRVFGF